MITGKDLIAWGHTPGPWFADALTTANAMAADGAPEAGIRRAMAERAPPDVKVLPLAPTRPFHVAIEAKTEDERQNVAAVTRSMRELMRTPVVEAGAVMPDACPAGPEGTIPVGGIVATKGTIHPGMHSADVCCSMAITVVGPADPKAVLDAAHAVTHFGGGGRSEARRVTPPADVMARFEANPFLAPAMEAGAHHFATQCDGNHFLFVGRLRSSGETAIVTHHGSRKPGAMLYKAGMAAADALRKQVSPETRRQNAWLDAESAEGEAYWEALQVIRAWTKASHFAIHDMALERLGMAARDRFWNEHNFVFRRGDRFLHGKGATPAWSDYADDASGLVLIPLNMAEPVLIARGRDKAEALGFCPHGAGRNTSRSEHMRRLGGLSPDEAVAAETEGLDARFYTGIPDASELPSAYKRASEVVRQIEAFGLADIVDYVDPYGSIMAGDWMAPFLAKKRKGKRKAA